MSLRTAKIFVLAAMMIATILWAPLRAQDRIDPLQKTLADFKFDKPAQSLAFDIGASEKLVTPGFSAVPIDRAFRDGFGWVLSKDQKINPFDTRYEMGYPTMLESTGVMPQQGRKYTFACELPNGRYVCTVYMGGIWHNNVPSLNHFVVVDGERVVHQERSVNDLMDQEFWRFVEATLVTSADLTDKGHKIFREYIAPRYQRHDFEVEVVNGKLALEIVSGRLNALVITPMAQKAEHEAAMKALDAEREREFVKKWANLLPNNAYQGAYKPTEDDQARGYVIFHRNWMRRTEHDTRPEPDWVGTDIFAAATPGEYEPASFSIWPLQDMPKVAVTVGQGRTEGGLTLPADTVRVWYFQQRPQRKSFPAGGYWLISTFLPDWGESRPLFKDMAQGCWLSIHLPADAKPGDYIFPVRVAPEGGRPSTVNLTVRVLPFTLERPVRMNTMRYASGSAYMPYNSSTPVKPGDIRNREYYRQLALEFMHELGMQPEYSGIRPSVFDGATGKLNNSDQAKGAYTFLESLKASPFGKQDMLFMDDGYGGDRMRSAFGDAENRWTLKQVDDYLINISQLLKSYGYEKVFIQVVAEESHDMRSTLEIEGMLKYMRENQAKWPNIFATNSSNTEWGQALSIKYAGLPSLGIFHGCASEAASRQIADAQAAGKPFTFYGVPGRILPGYYLWKAKGFGTYNEAFGDIRGFPNDDWDSPLGTGGSGIRVQVEAPPGTVAVPSLKRMISSWFAEEIREGIDDDAYLTTLENWIKRTADDKHAAVIAARQQAQTALDQVAKAVPLDVPDKGDPLTGYELTWRPFPEEDFDAMRWKVARAIAALKAAVETNAVATVAAAPPAAKAQPVANLIQQISWREGDLPVRINYGGMQWIPRAFAEPLDGTIKIDGRLDEPFYAGDPAFNTMHTLSYSPTPDKNAGWLFEKDGILYVGIRCAMPDTSQLHATGTKPTDDLEADDNFQIFIDPKHDHTSYYQLVINTSGVAAVRQFDRAPAAGGKGTLVKPWKAAVAIDKGEVTCEVAVPLRELGLVGQCFGMNIGRSSPSRHLNLVWARYDNRVGGYHQPEGFGNVGLPGCPAILQRIDLEDPRQGPHTVKLYIRNPGEAPRAQTQPLSVTLTRPDGKVEALHAPGGDNPATPGNSLFSAPYTLGPQPGLYTLAVRSGDTVLGLYPLQVPGSYLEFTERPRSVLVAGRDKVLPLEVRWPWPLDVRPEECKLQVAVGFWDVIQEGKGVVEGVQAKRWGMTLDVSDFAPGPYFVELSIVDKAGKVIGSLGWSFEILPSNL